MILLVQVLYNMLSYPLFRSKGDKFFSYRVKNLLFLSFGLDREPIIGEL